MGRPTTAKDIMVTKLVTLQPESDVHEAIDQLLRHRVSGAPVVDANFQLVGMLSEKDCLKRLIAGAYDRRPSATVAACMSTQVTTVSEDSHLLTVADLFLNHPFRRLPVVRGGKLVGQISRRDLLRALNEVLRIDEHRDAALLYLSAVNDGDPPPVL